MATAKELTEKLLMHYPFVYCPTLATKTTNKTPHRGDIVLFYRNGTFAHTGLVYNVSGGTYYTIEGNTSGASGVIANGGGVCKKQYSTSSYPGTKFFRPNYDIVGDADKVIDSIITTAEAEVGYLEKKSNANLDDKTANAGSSNYTKYWRDIYPSFQAQAWCACFVTWCVQKGIENMDTFEVKESVHPFVKVARKYNKLMKEDVKNGHKWFYSNSGTRSSFSNARKYGDYKTNCAKWVTWIFVNQGILKKGQYFYGEHGRIIYGGTGTEAAIRAKCDIIDVKGKTVSQLVKDGTVQPGDVCIYQDMQHTNMKGMKDYWWDAGHAYAKGTGEGATFSTWLGKAVHSAQRVKYIIRLRQPYKYMVIAGTFDVKANAVALVEKLKAKGLNKSAWRKIDGKYYAYTGEFKSLENAKKRAEKTKAAGYDCWILH